MESINATPYATRTIRDLNTDMFLSKLPMHLVVGKLQKLRPQR